MLSTAGCPFAARTFKAYVRGFDRSRSLAMTVPVTHAGIVYMSCNLHSQLVRCEGGQNRFAAQVSFPLTTMESYAIATGQYPVEPPEEPPAKGDERTRGQRECGAALAALCEE